MQTHKNTALRAGPAPFKAPVVSNTHRPVSAPKPIEKTPSLYKDGKKWIVVSGFVLKLTSRLLACCPFMWQ
jgi:adenylyl cyclase-associated protein